MIAHLTSAITNLIQDALFRTFSVAPHHLVAKWSAPSLLEMVEIAIGRKYLPSKALFQDSAVRSDLLVNPGIKQLNIVAKVVFNSLDVDFNDPNLSILMSPYFQWMVLGLIAAAAVLINVVMSTTSALLLFMIKMIENIGCDTLNRFLDQGLDRRGLKLLWW